MASTKQRLATAKQRKDGHNFVTKFWNSNNKQNMASLKTKDRDLANFICTDLTHLSNNYNTATEQNPFAKIYERIHPRAFELFFGIEKPIDIIEVDDLPDEPSPDSGTESNANLYGALYAKIDRLQKEVERLTPYERKYNAITNTIEGRQARALEMIPDTSKVVKLFWGSLGLNDNKIGANQRKNSKSLYTAIQRFLETLGRKKIADIKSHDLAVYMENASQNVSGSSDWKRRYNRMLQQFHQFFAFVEERWELRNITKSIKKKKEPPKTLPEFHSLEEIEAAINRLDEPIIEHHEYWQMVVAMLSYTGMINGSLRGLKVSDLDSDLTRVNVRSNEYRSLKTFNRNRPIEIEQDRLKPLLEKYLASDYPSKKPNGLLFPTLIPRKNGLEIWDDTQFSRRLTGHYQLNDGVYKWLEGALFRQKYCHATTGDMVGSEGEPLSSFQMDNRSIRRTFGSLLLRGGVSLSQISAIMGSDIKTINKHYAKWSSDEVQLTGKFGNGIKVNAIEEQTPITVENENKG